LTGGHCRHGFLHLPLHNLANNFNQLLHYSAQPLVRKVLEDRRRRCLQEQLFRVLASDSLPDQFNQKAQFQAGKLAAMMG
jgi:hypothetical protein